MNGEAARAQSAGEAGGGRRRIGSRASVLLAALLLTVLNAYKPLAMDDAAYYQYAIHIAQHPLDPYGFEVYWGARPEPAFEVLAAPLLPYWWAGAIRLFGERPVLWKLSLFPFALLLATSLNFLLAHFAPGRERPLLWLLLFSPAVLPAFNLMLDVPALALSLSSLALFIAACDGDHWGRVAMAGLIAGLAVQTKQTSITVVAAILAYGLLFARLRLALLAAAAAAAVFAGWELLMALHYGESHFLHARSVRAGSVSLRGIGFLALGFTSLLGGVAAAAVPLGLVGLSERRWPAAVAILLSSLAFAAIPLLPAELLPQLHMSPRLGAGPAEQYVFTALGCGVVVVAIAVGWRLLTTSGGRSAAEGGWRAEAPGGNASTQRRLDLFLLGWLLIELLGCFAIWTFLASRHVFRLALVVLLLCGRAAASRRSADGERRLLRWVTVWGVGVGLLFYAADLSDSLARRDAVRRSAEQLTALGADRERESVWYLGHWGFQFYAESLGMKPVVPGESRLEAGDWLVAPEGVSRQKVWIPTTRVVREALVEARSPWPWSSIPSFYAGPIPLRSQPKAQLLVDIYRVTRGFQATGPSRRPAPSR